PPFQGTQRGDESRRRNTSASPSSTTVSAKRGRRIGARLYACHPAPLGTLRKSLHLRSHCPRPALRIERLQGRREVFIQRVLHPPPSLFFPHGKHAPP